MLNFRGVPSYDFMFDNKSHGFPRKAFGDSPTRTHDAVK